MACRRVEKYLRLCALTWLGVCLLIASEHRGEVTFGGLPVPGATVTATEAGKTLTAITDEQGVYSFADLADGSWRIAVEMLGFSKTEQDVIVAPNAPVAKWELKLLPLDRIKAEIQPVPGDGIETALPPRSEKTVSQNDPASHPEMSPDDLTERAADGFLINGSANNGAASPFAQAMAFGNNRSGAKGLYNGGIGMILDNSALDARPFSLTGQNTPKAAYNRLTGVATLGGPVRIPHLLRNGPNVFLGYQWTRNRNATTESALMPDLAERNGIFWARFSIQLLDGRFPATWFHRPGSVLRREPCSVFIRFRTLRRPRPTTTKSRLSARRTRTLCCRASIRH